MKWSRVVLPKVFGAVFLTTTCHAVSEYEEALNAAKKAAMIQSGLTKQIVKLKKQTVNEAKDVLKKYEILEETAIVGGVLQIIRDKAIKVKHEGVDYFIAPLQVRVTFRL